MSCGDYRAAMAAAGVDWTRPDAQSRRQCRALMEDGSPEAIEWDRAVAESQATRELTIGPTGLSVEAARIATEVARGTNRQTVSLPDGRPNLAGRLVAMSLAGKDALIDRMKAEFADRLSVREYLALMAELGIDPNVGEAAGD